MASAGRLGLWFAALLALQFHALRPDRFFDPDTASYLVMSSYPGPGGVLQEPLEHRPPAILLLFRAFAVLFGPYPLLPLQLFYLLLAALGAGLVARFHARQNLGSSGTVAGWLFVLGASAPRPLLGPAPDLPLSLLQVLAALSLWRLLNGGGFLCAPLSGFLAGAASFFKFQGALWLVFGAFAIARMQEAPPWQRARRLLGLGAGAGTFWVLAWGALTLAGAWDHLSEWGFSHAFAYAQGMEGNDPWHLISHSLWVIGFCWWPLWGGLFWTLGRWLKGRGIKPPERFLLLWVGVLLLQVPLGPYTFGLRYFLPALAPLSLLAARRLEGLSTGPSRLSLVALLLFGGTAAAYHAVYACRNPLLERVLAENREMARRIRERSKPEEGIVVLEQHRSALYVLAGRPPATPFPYWLSAQKSMPEHPFHHPAYRSIPAHEMERDLARRRPRFIVDPGGEFAWMARAMPAFASRYVLDRRVGDFKLWRRGDEAQ